MVHALDEVRRVLAPGGLLVDLRPLSEDAALEINAGPERQVYIGALDESHYIPDDRAADRAIATAVACNWFQLVGDWPFDFRWYFDSLDELVETATDEWEDKIDDATLTRAAERLAALPPTARLCVRRGMRFGVYQKS